MTYSELLAEAAEARAKWKYYYRRFWWSLAVAMFFTGMIAGIALRGILP